MFPRGHVYRYHSSRGLLNVPTPGVPGGIFSVPYDVGGFPFCDVAHQQVYIGALALALSNATPEQRRMVCMFPF